jgi:hypothetical protein
MLLHHRAIVVITIIIAMTAPIHGADAREYRFQPIPPDAPISDERAYQYYKNCRRLSPPRFSEKPLEEFCLCASDKLRTDFSQRDIYFLRQADSARLRKQALIKYVETVVAPCAPKPVAMIFQTRCMAERGQDPRVDNLRATCRCLGERMTKWTKTNAGAVIARQISQHPEDYRNNPLSALMEARRLLTGRTDQLLHCIRNNQ